jgi:hypothetical protein
MPHIMLLFSSIFFYEMLSEEKLQAMQSTLDAFFKKKVDNSLENEPQWGPTFHKSYLVHIFVKSF